MPGTKDRSPQEDIVGAQVSTRRAQFALNVSKTAVWAIVPFLVVTTVLWLFFRQYVQLLAIPILMLLPLAGASVYPILHRQGRVRAGIILLLLSILLDIGLVFLAIPELFITMTVIYVLVMIFAYLLLESEQANWVAAACIVVFGFDVVVNSFWPLGWFTRLDENTGLILGAFLGISMMVPAAVLVRQILGENDTFFRRSLQANLEVEQRALAEQQLRERLQSVVHEYARYTVEVGQGNLAARLPLDGEGQEEQDPLILLGHNLNTMAANLQRMILKMRDAASALGSASAEILAATTQQASGATEQSAAISQTNTTVEEVRTIAEQMVLRAQEVAEAAQRTVDVYRRGQRSVQETVENIAGIKVQVEGISENIVELSRQTQQIGGIIATVNELASQSNVLALNASVEAARAGEHGKGFSVVAVEMRNLAQQSKRATEEVGGILSDIRKATTTTVLVTEEGVKGVDAGVQSASQTSQVITQLAEVIDESAQAAMQMAAGGRQQASGMEQVALSIQSISQAMVQSLASTRQAEKAAQNLNDLARNLNEIVEQYQL